MKSACQKDKSLNPKMLLFFFFLFKGKSFHVQFEQVYATLFTSKLSQYFYNLSAVSTRGFLASQIEFNFEMSLSEADKTKRAEEQLEQYD